MDKRQTDFYSDGKVLFNHAVYEDPEDRFEFHTHDTLEIILFLRGDVSYVVDGEQYAVGPNDIALVRPFTYHCVKVTGPEVYERYDILLDETVLPAGTVEKLFSGKKLVSYKASSTVKNIFQRLIHYCTEFAPKDIGSLVSALMTELFYVLMYESDRGKHPVPFSVNGLIQRAVAYIDGHITTLTSLEEVYSALEISKCQFHRIFLRELGITPMEYIKDKRLALGCKALHEGKKATEVYLQCGFTSYTTFYRLYKEKYGYAPSEEVKKAYPVYKIKS